MKAFGPALDPRCCCFDGWDIGQIALDKCRSGITVFFYFFSSKGDIVLFAPFVQRVVVSVLVAAQDEHFVYLVEEQLRRDILFRLACAYKTRLHGDLPRPMPAWPPWVALATMKAAPGRNTVHPAPFLALQMCWQP